jgi:hypothetical protein
MSKRTPLIPWYVFTRTLGTFIVLYGLLVDHSGDRATIILTGAGIAGFDKVSRSEKPK